MFNAHSSLSLSLFAHYDDTDAHTTRSPPLKLFPLVFFWERERVREKNIFWVFEHHHREEYHTGSTVVLMMMMMRE